MHTLIIDQRGTVLQYSSGAIQIRLPDEKPKSISLNMLRRLVIAGAAQIDSALLTHLAERNISLIAMPARGARRAANMYSMSHGDAQRRIQQYAITQDASLSLALAKRFIKAKINGNIRMLRKALSYRADKRNALINGISELQEALANIRQVESLESARGIEGAASARFFNAYKALFKPDLEFNARNRRPPKDPVNAVLSLGYTLCHNDAVSTILKCGLDPMLGFLHDPAYNRDSLACDLNEITRPLVEQLTWRLFAEKKLEASQFTLDGEACRMGKAARQVFFSEFEAHASTHRRWLKRYAKQIAALCIS